jgi:hypothetical protein
MKVGVVYMSKLAIAGNIPTRFAPEDRLIMLSVLYRKLA